MKSDWREVVVRIKTFFVAKVDPKRKTELGNTQAQKYIISLATIHETECAPFNELISIVQEMLLLDYMMVLTHQVEA